MEHIDTINTAAEAYFEENTQQDIIPAKKLMPALIAAGLFIHDEKNGLPLRKVLKQIDSEGQLEQLPALHVVRKGKHSFWYFKREGHTPENLEIDKMPSKESSRKQLSKRENSDEGYVIDLCDEVLELRAVRKHTFDYLKGDLHRNGRTRSKLPCDAYYSAHKLVVEYIAPLPPTPADGYDSPALLSSSGKTRSEMRKIYAERKRNVLGKRKVQLVEIEASQFEQDDNQLIRRDKERDLEIVRTSLANIKKGKPKLSLKKRSEGKT